MSRLHLGMGIFAYLASPLWLAMLLLSSSLVVNHKLAGDVYFGPTRTLFPIWPQIRWPEIHGLLILTAVLLFGPKLFALALRLWSTRNARRFGGRLRLIVSFLGEVAAHHPARAGDDAVPHHVRGPHPGRQCGRLAAAAARRSRHAVAGRAAAPHPSHGAGRAGAGDARRADADLSAVDPAGR